MPIMPTLPPPTTFVYDLRILFVFVGVLLCLFTTGLFFWITAQIPKVDVQRRYKLIPYTIAAFGSTLLTDSLFGFLGYEVWKTRNFPQPANEHSYLLIIPITIGAVIWMIATLIHFRQYGKGYLWLISASSRKRENHDVLRRS
jgi:hypothetical protein